MRWFCPPLQHVRPSFQKRSNLFFSSIRTIYSAVSFPVWSYKTPTSSSFVCPRPHHPIAPRLLVFELAVRLGHRRPSLIPVSLVDPEPFRLLHPSSLVQSHPLDPSSYFNRSRIAELELDRIRSPSRRTPAAPHHRSRKQASTSSPPSSSTCRSAPRLHHPKPGASTERRRRRIPSRCAAISSIFRQPTSVRVRPSAHARKRPRPSASAHWYRPIRSLRSFLNRFRISKDR